MAITISQVILPTNSANKSALAVDLAAISEVGDDAFKVYVNDDVPLSRLNEIYNKVEWLLQGVFDRNLIVPTGQFDGFVLYTMSNLDEVVSGRRTSSTFADIQLADVAIGIGLNVTAQVNQKLILVSSMTQCRDKLLEELKDGVAA